MICKSGSAKEPGRFSDTFPLSDTGNKDNVKGSQFEKKYKTCISNFISDLRKRKRKTK